MSWNDDPIPIEEVESAYNYAIAICDPVEYSFRQRKLLYTVAKYLIERDRPKFEGDPKDLNPNLLIKATEANIENLQAATTSAMYALQRKLRGEDTSDTQITLTPEQKHLIELTQMKRGPYKKKKKSKT